MISNKPLFFDAPTTGSRSADESYTNEGLDISEIVAPQKASTYFMIVDNSFMEKSGIYNDDIVSIDKSLPPKSGDVVIAFVEDEFVIRRLKKQSNKAWLQDDLGRKTELDKDSSIVIWGVVTYSIHKLH